MYKVKLEIINFDDIINFTKQLKNIKEFNILTPDEKLSIIYSYPFRFEFINESV